MPTDSVVDSTSKEQGESNGADHSDKSSQVSGFETAADGDEAHGLDIPHFEPRDGLFDYREEKTMMLGNHHVPPGAWAGSQNSPTHASFFEDARSEASRRNSTIKRDAPSKPLIHDWMKNQEGPDQESEVTVEHHPGAKTRAFVLAYHSTSQHTNLHHKKTLPSHQS